MKMEREEILDRVFETDTIPGGRYPSSVTAGLIMKVLNYLEKQDRTHPGNQRGVPTKMQSIERQMVQIDDQIKQLTGDPANVTSQGAFDKNMDAIGKLIDKKHALEKEVLAVSQAVFLNKLEKQIQTNSVQEDHYDEPANDSEEDMLDNQVAFIKYAVDEIQDFVKANGDFPEWFQNKFTSVHENVKTLHAFIEGERNKEKRKEMVAMKDREDDYFETLEAKLAQEAEINWAKPDDPTYYVRIKGGKPMIEITAGKFAPVIPSKKWQEITPAISDKAYKQGFRTAPIEGVDGKKYQALVGWLESKKTEVAFVSAKDFVELKNPVKSSEVPSDAGPDGGMK